MVIGLLRVKKCKLRTSKALLPVPAIISACQFRIFSSMREGNVISTASGTEENIRLPPIKVHFTPEIEKKYVHRVYDAIAPHFSSTRFAKWPKVATFLKSLPSGSVVLDAGCGNGKYLGLHPECYFIGCDISASLIKICSDRDHEVLVADAVNLPYRTGFGDAAISIAVLHHLSTEQRRKKAIEELVRVVKKGGLVLITVWAMEQEDKNLLTKWTPLVDKYVDEWVGPGSPRVRSSPSQTLESISEADGNTVKGSKFDFAEYVDEWVGPSSPRVRSSPSQTLESISEADGNPVKGSKFDFAEKSNEIVDLAFDSMDYEDKDSDQQEYFVPWHLPYHRAEVGGSSASALESGLAKKDDKKGAVVYNRYYHVFNEGELERLVSGMDNVSVVDRFFDKSNWCIVLEKTC